MKRKGNVNIILLSFSILLGFMLVVQMKQHVESYNLVTLKSIQIKKNEIINSEKEIEELKLLIKEKQGELKKLEEFNDKGEDIQELLVDESNKNKVIAGFTDMEGPGIVIKMQDNQNIEVVGSEIKDDVIHDADILEILNDLRVAGAEAISINGQRVMPMSEIKCGGPIIRVNGKSLGSPFVIKAIGNSKQLYAAINAPGTYGYTLKNVYKISIESTVEDKIHIPAYSGYFSFYYAKPIKEGD